LKSTTIRTWVDWMPMEYGKMRWDAPISHRIQAEDLDLEVMFLALDQDQDVRKLLSLELTGGWLNEARSIPKAIVDALTGRVGRYPAMKDGGPSWRGIIADTNPPDSESWWYALAQRTDPEIQRQIEALERELREMGALEESQPLYEFFDQPSGLSPEAENLQNLDKGYYQRLAAGKDEDWVKVYVHGDYGFVADGKPVYPMFRDRIHVAEHPLAPIPGLEIIVGADLGLTPAGIFGQRLPDGRLVILDELCTEDCGLIRFSERAALFARNKYPDHVIGAGWFDPAGLARSTTDEKTAKDILEQYTGWKWRPAPTNEWDLRREAVVSGLNRLVDGNPGLLVSPTCKMIRKGFVSGYHFKFVRNTGGTQVHEKPAKNNYSHPHEALQYLALGSGEYDVVFHGNVKRKRRGPRIADGVGESPFGGPIAPAQPRYMNAQSTRDLLFKPKPVVRIARGVYDDV
jgi:hypothetical protein